MPPLVDRRSFLKLFGLAAPVAAVAPSYFFAPKGGWKRSQDGLWLRPTNASAFYDGQIIQSYDGFGGLAQETPPSMATISYVDVRTNTIWFTSPLKAKVGDYIVAKTDYSKATGLYYGDGAGVIDVIKECDA